MTVRVIQSRNSIRPYGFAARPRDTQCLRGGFILKRIILIVLLVFAAASILHAGEHELKEEMTNLMMQIGIILFAARLMGVLFKKINLPEVLGEITAGIIIGPYLLGGLALPGFSNGFFPLPPGSEGIPIAEALYAFATLASIILLFAAGLETDLSLFLRYTVKGSLVGLGGIVVPFVFGDAVGMLLLDKPFMDPSCLFLGLIAVATSVGISARILSGKRRMDSPEGVTILAAAVIDDVVGIIMLAVVVGITAMSDAGGRLDVGKIGLISLKAVGVWLGCTAAGLLLAKYISGFLKLFKNITVFSILALGLALLLAGIFEKAGLAMIIGAYVMGLSLSKTDISIVIQEKLDVLHSFFVPVFFTVMGMMVNIHLLLSPVVLLTGALYFIAAFLGKVLGGGLPALCLGFNLKGSLRIGIGLVPRGEVALIIAGIGLSSGVIGNEIFSLAVMMTLLTILVSPPLFSKMLSIQGRGTRKELRGSQTEATVFDFPSRELTEFLVNKIVAAFASEGFFIHRRDLDYDVYQFRKNEVSVTMTITGSGLAFESEKEDVSFIKTMVYESLLDLHDTVDKIRKVTKPASLRKELLSENSRVEDNIFKVLTTDCIKLQLQSTEKWTLIEEMIDILDSADKLNDRDAALKAVVERERSMSTGMQHGIALPHGKTTAVETMHVAVGLKKEGIDFDSIDQQAANIFIMVVSSSKKTGPHIQFLSTISSILNKPESRELILSCSTERDILNYLLQEAQARKK